MEPCAPTHDPVDFEQLWQLGEALSEAAGGQPIAPETIDALAAERGVPRAHAWMALANAPMVRVARHSEVALGVCCARCQLWGAAPLVEALLALRDARLAEGRPAFDLVPRGCLNRCEQAPVATAALPDGLVGFQRCTAEDVAELLDAIEG